MAQRVIIDGSRLTIDDVHRVARLGAQVALSPQARRKVAACWKAAGKLSERGERLGGTAIGGGRHPDAGEYQGAGKNQGAAASPGEFANAVSGYCGASFGDAEPVETVRAAILCRANTLARGRSIARPETIAAFIELLNRGVTPLVYRKSAVGTGGEGDCLSQIAEVLLGRGEAFLRGEIMPGALALKKVELEPVVPAPAETVALLNGSPMPTGELALRCLDAETILKNAVIASAMTIDVLGCPSSAFDPRIHGDHPFPGQIAVADGIRRIAQGSGCTAEAPGRIGNGYSLRCAAQILSPSCDTLAFVRRIVTTEMNSAIDETLFYTEGREALASGNFHGQPIAIAADFLGIAIGEAANLSERHTRRLLNPALGGLPASAFGKSRGLKEAQRTAASLARENRILSHPAAIDPIGIADEEDHVSPGSIAVHKLHEICANASIVLAIEMMCAARLAGIRRLGKPGIGVRTAIRSIRKAVPGLAADRSVRCDIEELRALVANGQIIRSVERAVGPIGLGEYPD